MYRFTLWAPRPEKIAVQVNGKTYPMQGPNQRGYWNAVVDEAKFGDEYGFLIDDDPMVYPDPRSYWQPHGVHNPSKIYDQRAFNWDDKNWQGPPLTGAIIYEMHVGTFSPEGTFDGAVTRLDYLLNLGITHIEVMPIAEFAGNRGWGYDGVGLFAVNSCYGGPDGFKRFVNGCHVRGIAVLLDCVYNHFGPVGNYTGKFGPYTTDKHHTPWGDAINFEDVDSDGVRQFFFDNAMMWMRDYHVDGLRLDAIHEIIDRSAVHFLEQLSAIIDNLSATLGRRLVLIAESDLNNPMIVKPIEAGGFGMDAQWSDDFHHSLFSLLHVEQGTSKGYYDDFGDFESLAKSLKQMFVYDGIYSGYRHRHHGRPVDGLSAHRFVGFIQNHDQVGNRAVGDRLGQIVGVPRSKIALGIVLTAPFIPMLFQGEEFAASSPFLYFADHEDEEMAKQVAAGRKKEFAAFGWNEDEVPNPEDAETFKRSKLEWTEIGQGEHAEMLEWVRELIRLRRRSVSLNDGDRGHVRITFSEEKCWLRMDRGAVTIVANLGCEPLIVDVSQDQRLVLASQPGVELGQAKLVLPANVLAITSSEEP